MRWAALVVLIVAAVVLAGVLLRSGPERRLQPEAPAPAQSPALAEAQIVRQPGLEEFLPKTLEPEYGFVGSDACRSCHTAEHASWHDSYHRTMTQPATPQNVQAPFDGMTLDFNGKTAVLTRLGDEFWVEIDDPDWERRQAKLGIGSVQPVSMAPRVSKQIVMTTGSHHKQTFWMYNPDGQFLSRFPWNYRIDDQRWVPTEHDFLTPPDQPERSYLFSFWNSQCFQCHAVGGQPRYESRSFNTRVAELGISCEACHGPGADHVKTAEAAKAAGGPLPGTDSDRPIVSPLTRSHERSSQICGQCHSFFWPKDLKTVSTSGHSYRAGDDLHATRHILQYTTEPEEAWLIEMLKQRPNYLESIFWKDGAVRVTGREFNGLEASACYQHGELSCTSCHSMHNYVSNADQLATGMDGNKACLQCHTEYEAGLTDHTHHQSESSGSLCYNCHMPHTTYGLFKAIRSHRVDSSSVANTLQTGRPHACNLCHLDKTLAWTAKHEAQWYETPQAELSEDDEQIAASLLWLLRGDAVQRAIAAWHYGWEPAREASGEEWLAPYLAHGLDDPYSAVRNVARRSLRKLPGYAEWDYDFLADDESRAETVSEVIGIWERRAHSTPPKEDARILLNDRGEIDYVKVDLLRMERDNRPIEISE